VLNDNINLATVNKAGAWIQGAKNIVLTCHYNPDGDAIGSCLGLQHILKDQGKAVSVIVPNDFPGFLRWMPGAKKIVINKQNPEKAIDLIHHADLIICLDFNQVSRLDTLQGLIKNTSAKSIMIDHHLEPEAFTDLMLSNPKASSTGEMVFEFSAALWGKKAIDYNAAICLYVAIMTDTGSFQYSCTTDKVHSIVADLLKTGISPNEIYDQVFNQFSENRMKLFGFCLAERMEILPHLHLGIINLSQEDLRKFKNRKGDTEGIVNLPLQIKGIRMAVLVTERESEVKLSFRSKGIIDVSSFARKYFNGGGHYNAAGGSSSESLSSTISTLKKNIIETKISMS